MVGFVHQYQSGFNRKIGYQETRRFFGKNSFCPKTGVPAAADSIRRGSVPLRYRARGACMAQPFFVDARLPAVYIRLV